MKIEMVCPDCGASRLRWPYEVRQQQGPRCNECKKSTRARAQMTTHGARFHPLYNTWKNLRRRISDKHFKNHYGLDIDPAWQDVWVFIEWATAAGWKPGLSIERIDNNRGYWPDNCCFIPFGDQARHTSRNTMNWGIANEIKERVAAGEVKFHVAKAIAEKYKIPVGTVAAVAYNRAWV